MRAFDFVASIFWLLVVVLMLPSSMVSDVFAQGFAAPSGCRTSTVKNTLLFTQTRTGNPDDTNVVVGAFTVTDDQVEDTGVVAYANCTPPGPADVVVNVVG